jgi:hypothetical protein
VRIARSRPTRYPTLIHAAMRIDELSAAGDMDGAAVWKQVLRAVDEPLVKAPSQSASLHYDSL